MTPDAIQRAVIRADVWRLLALAFGQPTRAALDQLCALAADLLPALEKGPHALYTPLCALRDALGAAEPQVVEHEYHVLFTTRMLAPPYEGAYHRASRGAVVGDVAAFHTAFGLRLRPEHGAADSLQNELALLAWLALKETYAIERQLIEQVEITRNATRAFLLDHLGRWACAFVERLAGVTTSPFYLDAGNLLIAAMNEFTREFAVRCVIPLSAGGAPPEPDAVPCPAAGACRLAE